MKRVCRSMSPNNNLLRVIFIGAVALVILAYIFVVTGNPISAFVYAGHDDALFFRALESILRGEWLGQYDNRTLVKGPMLSIIGAFSAIVGVPAKTAEAIIYLIAVVVLFLVVRRIGLHWAAAAALVVLSLFNPFFFSSGNRYLRDFLYAAFAMLLVVLAMGAISNTRGRTGNWFAAGAGFFTGCACLTREEDIWIIATLTTLLVAAALVNTARNGISRALEIWRIVVGRAFFFTVALAGIVMPVMLANYVFYGSAVVSEFRSSEFRGAMGALGRVGEIHPSGYVLVPQGTLEAVFQVAPVTMGVKEHWQRVSSGWSAAGAHLIPDYPSEVAGGWFAWAFRDAVAAAGHHASALAARGFYARLAQEVNAACDEGTLTCRRERASLAPELTFERLPSLIAASWTALLHTVSMEGGPVTAARSQGDVSTLIRWNQLIGPVVAGSSKEFLISGWVANMTGHQPIIATVTDSPIHISDLSTRAGPDVVAHFKALGTKGVGVVRFSMIVKCLKDGCGISVMTAEGERQFIALDKLAQGQKGSIALQPPFVGWFDVVDQHLHASLRARPFEDLRLAIAAGAVRVAQVAVPILAITATIGMLLYLMCWHQQRRSDGLFVLAACAASAIIVRSIIIGFIDITSWRAVTVGYLGPAYGFVIIYSVVGTAILFNILRANARSPRKLPRQVQS